MRRLVSLLALTAAILAGCGGRSLDSPANRLVGHWSTGMEDHLYFSETSRDGIGSYVVVQDTGNTVRHSYRILSEDPGGEEVLVLLLFSDGDQREDVYIISQDGLTADSTTEILGMSITSRLRYVDGKEEP